jgi:hypothetical protein
MTRWNFVLVQKKTVIQKKKLLLQGTLKDWTKFTTQNKEKQKQNQSFFRDNFVLAFTSLGNDAFKNSGRINDFFSNKRLLGTKRPCPVVFLGSNQNTLRN